MNKTTITTIILALILTTTASATWETPEWDQTTTSHQGGGDSVGNISIRTEQRWFNTLIDPERMCEREGFDYQVATYHFVAKQPTSGREESPNYENGNEEITGWNSPEECLVWGGAQSFWNQYQEENTYKTSLKGCNPKKTTWTSDSPIDGIVTVASTSEGYWTNTPETKAYEGGYNGTILEDGEGKKYYKMIVFCKYASPGSGGNNGGGTGGEPHGVPEFNTITLAAAIIVAGLGMIVIRKQ